MSEILLPQDARVSRRVFVSGATGLIITAALSGCAKKENSSLVTITEKPGPNVDSISPEELELPQYSLAALQNNELIQTLVGLSVQTSGYLNIVDQDESFYNIYGKTLQGDNNAYKQVEELTYTLTDSPENPLVQFYAVQKREYPLPAPKAGYDFHKTLLSNSQQRWLAIGKIQQGRVEIGNSANSYVESPYIQIKRLYSIN